MCLSHNVMDNRFRAVLYLDRLFFSDLSYLVIDEADSMFDSTFKQDPMELLQLISVSEK